MARLLPQVKDSLLYSPDGSWSPIVLDSPAWFRWLEQHSSFAFSDPAGALTVRKERSGYWKGYRHSAGKLYTVYLGRSADLTLVRLRDAAQSVVDRPSDAPITTRPAPPPSVSTDQAAISTLLRTKFVVPAARRRGVVRSSLLARLCAEPLAPVVLVAAPPGYGKTTIVADWIASDRRAAAWVSLDSGDNDPIRFWSAVVLALTMLQPGVVASALELLRAPSALPITTIMAAVLNDLTVGLAPDPAGRPVLLMLDDYHVIEQRAIHETMATFVERLPIQLQLVIASRADPPLPTARLRVRGQLLEIRAAELAFSEQETATFLGETMGLRLSEPAIAMLATRTEGWIAALQLAALSLRSQLDPTAFIATFGGSHQQLMAYLVDEVFDRQPAPVQKFLLATSVLERMCAGLCDAVLLARDLLRPAQSVIPSIIPAHQTSQDMLEMLEAANLFVISLNTVGHWYRYHQLFAETVRQRLRRIDPGLELKLRRHAAAWYEQAGYAHEAIEQALAGEDWEFAARLLEAFNEQLWRRGERATFERWLHALPPHLVAHRPRLGLLTARRYCSQFRFRAAELLLLEIEQTLAQQEAEAAADRIAAPVATVVRAQAAVLRGYAALMYRGDLGEAEALARAALAQLPPDNLDWQANASSILAAVDYNQGNLERAQQRYAETAALAQKAADHTGFFYACQGHEVLIDMGRLREAQACCDELYQQAAEWKIQDMPASSFIDCLSAHIHYETNDLAEAERVAMRALEVGQRGQVFFSRWYACIILSWVYLTRHDTTRALQMIAMGEALVAPSVSPGYSNPPAWWALFAWRDHVLLTRQAYLGRADSGTDSSQLTSAAIARWTILPTTPDWPAHIPLARWAYRAVQLLPARARILQGDTMGALAYLERICTAAAVLGANGMLISARALQALALEQLGKRADALDTLQHALTLAEPEGYIRSIIDTGPGILPLLRALEQEQLRAPSRNDTRYDYLRRLSNAAALQLSAARASDHVRPEALLDSPFEGTLTGRELAILTLLAAGYSNQQIADQLVIAVSTVKWYLRLIYDKLGVVNRTQAVARARDYGLLH